MRGRHARIVRRPWVQSKTGKSAMELNLRKESDGFHVVDGHMRLRVALSMSDEVVVHAPGVGDVLIAKLPDGRLVATQDRQTVALFGI